MRAASDRRRSAWGTWRISDLTESDHIRGDGDGRHRRRQGQDQREVGRRFRHADAAHGRGEDIGAPEHHSPVLLEHGQQQRQSTTVDTLRRAARRGGIR